MLIQWLRPYSTSLHGIDMVEQRTAARASDLQSSEFKHPCSLPQVSKPALNMQTPGNGFNTVTLTFGTLRSSLS